MSEKYVVTWDMLQIHARKLASRLLPVEQWKGIIAVSRGGLVPGALLARERSRASKAPGTSPPRLTAIMPFHCSTGSRRLASLRA